MKSPAVIASTAPVIRSTAPVMISAAVISTTMISATGEAAGARVITGIGIPVSAGVGSRSRAIPTAAAPSPGVGGHEKRCQADGNSESEYFTQHSIF
jgi:hypothetical protein